MARELNVRAVRYRPLVSAQDLTDEDRAVLAITRRLARDREMYETAMRLLSKCLMVAEIKSQSADSSSAEVVDLTWEDSAFE